MGILFGHPTGTPFSHQAALAHFEEARLDRFCVAWMPSPATLQLIEAIPGLRESGRRLARRYFAPLGRAPKVQGRIGEWQRLALRIAGCSNDRLSDQANDWLMRTMKRECRRSDVTAVHAYEDCSLWQFEEAKRRGKACIYDMPIAYYPAWLQIQNRLIRKYIDWLSSDVMHSGYHARLGQKRQELTLADLILAPSRFVEKTIRNFESYKQISYAPYGVDLDFWQPSLQENAQGPLRFIYAGQLSVRKGTPFLIEAWKKAELADAELKLVGPWLLADSQKRLLPKNVRLFPPCSHQVLRDHYRASDVFVFPSFFEGFGLVMLEAMACGLPSIASQSTAAPDVVTDSCGVVIPTGDIDALVDSLRSFYLSRDRLPAMRLAARQHAERFTWGNYRNHVKKAVSHVI
jgi:alpha-maltose-1-phosphate synthase